MSTNNDPYEELISIVKTISSPVIRDFTLEMLRVAPASFRTARASLNHHPVDERGPAGNCLHTLRVVKLVKLLADACDYNAALTSIITSAAAIHDLGRYGPDDKNEFTSQDHPFRPREIAKENSIDCVLASAIFSMAESHSGKWGKVPYMPTSTPADLLHFADMISAHAHEVWEPPGEKSSSWITSIPYANYGMTQEMMDIMAEIAEDNEYWKTALQFVRSTSGRKFNTLSEKQQIWVENIIASLAVEINKKEGRDVFNE